VADAVVGDLSVLVVSGAAYSALAFADTERRPGKALVAGALAVTVLVIVASAWMAGRWGGPA
jgi:hypothetical protein